MLPITRYIIKEKRLTPWVKFIWSLTLEGSSATHQLLPADTVDLLLSRSGTMKYYTKNMDYHAPLIHINGLRREHSMVRHSGENEIYGISFYAWGLYALIQEQVIKTKDGIVDLYNITPHLADKLDNILTINTPLDVFKRIEQALCTELRVCQNDLHRAGLIEGFLRCDDSLPVNQYCADRGINIKTFERMTVKYTGYTPKVLHRLRRFQTASNQLVHQQDADLAGIAYDNRFADQSHFIKEFEEFTGAPPRTFRNKKNSVKENAVYKFI